MCYFTSLLHKYKGQNHILAQTFEHLLLQYLWLATGGTLPETNEIVTHICSCHNFFPLSSVQILFIPACCLLCVL